MIKFALQPLLLKAFQAERNRQMILFGVLIALVFVDIVWLRWVAGILWFIGLILNAAIWPMYLIATGIVSVIALVVRGIVKSRTKD